MSSKFYHQFKADPKFKFNTSGFDETTDICTYEDMLKDDKLTPEDRLRIEKLKLARDRKLIIERLEKLKIK